MLHKRGMDTMANPTQILTLYIVSFDILATTRRWCPQAHGATSSGSAFSAMPLLARFLRPHEGRQQPDLESTTSTPTPSTSMVAASTTYEPMAYSVAAPCQGKAHGW